MNLKNKILWMRKIVLFVFVLGFLNGCAEQKPEKVYRISILSGLDYFANTAIGFKEKMAELGYVEGKNIIYDLRHTDFDSEAERKILKEFVADKPDLIVTYPTEVSRMAKDLAKSKGIPLVFSNANIEGMGLVDSVRAPGGNVTGVRYPGPDLALKRLEILLELVPNARRILVPYQRGYPIVPPQMEVLYPVAKIKGVTLEELPSSTAEELAAILEKRSQLPDAGVDAILGIAEPVMTKPDTFKIVAQFADRHGIPHGGDNMSVEGYESLFGVTIRSLEVGKQAAILADKVLRGIPAGTIPVVSANSYLRINYRAMKKMNIEPSEGLLSRADEITR